MAQFNFLGEVLRYRTEPDGAASSWRQAAGRPLEKTYVRLEVIDFHGRALSKTLPVRAGKEEQLKAYLYSGALAYGPNSEVMVIPDEIEKRSCPNLQLLPLWSTLQELPWASRPQRSIVVKRAYCEMANLSGSDGKLPVVPYTICDRLVKELEEKHGLFILAGGELEFTMARRDERGSWVPLFQGVDIFATLQNTKFMDFFYEVEQHMELVGVNIQTINAEYGAGQVEISFTPKLGTKACDMTATFRTGVKEMAQREGLRASFMAKPFGVRGVGNGGHFNFSLWRKHEAPAPYHDKDVEPDLDPDVAAETTGLQNALRDPEDPEGMSSTARGFLAGVLHHSAALEAVCSPTVPCYCRHGNWAPTAATWGHDDRNAAVRVKAGQSASSTSCYMELRLPSAAANPYLVMAGLLAAGMHGLEEDLPLPPAGQVEGAAKLPTCLPEALKALEADAYIVSKLGPDFVRWFLQVKRAELAALEERLKPSSSDEEVCAAWQHMYMELI